MSVVLYVGLTILIPGTSNHKLLLGYLVHLLTKMKSFLTVTALLEGFTGLALAIVPAMLISILLGTSLSQPAAILMARLAGAALITIAIGCWLIRNDSQSSAMVQAMLVYNILSVALLVYAAMTENIAGAGLWPVVFIHFVMLVWCVSSLRKRVQIRI